MAIVKRDSEIQVYNRTPPPSPRVLAGVIFRQRWVVLAVAVVVGIAMWLAGIWTPKYVAEMKILVLRQRVDAVITPEANSPVQWGGDQVSEEDLNSEVELLKSSDLLRNVVLECGLDHQRAIGLQSSPEKRIAAAVYLLDKHLKVESIRKTNMISVQYESQDPHLASRVLTALSEAYSEKHVEVHRPSGEFKFFDQQTAQYQQDVAATQQKIFEFNQQNGVVAPQVERDLALQRGNDFDSSAHQAQESVEEGTRRIEVLRKQLADMQPQVTAAVRTSSNVLVLAQMKEGLNTLELKHTEMLGRYAPTYRPIQDLERQISELKDAIEKETNSPLREETMQTNPVYQWLQQELTQTEAEVSTMKTRAVAAAAIAAQYRGKARALNQQSFKQEDLLRDEKAQEQNYVLYMHKREEARISDELDQRGIVNVAIVQHPLPPQFPVRTRQYALLMTLLMCVTFGVSSAFVADLMVPFIRTPDEVMRYLDAPVLACLPKVKGV